MYLTVHESTYIVDEKCIIQHGELIASYMQLTNLLDSIKSESKNQTLDRLENLSVSLVVSVRTPIEHLKSNHRL